MEQIYNNTKLPKDICNTIFKYINYTSETLVKLSNKNKYLSEQILEKMEKIARLPVLDLILKIVSHGFNGFQILCDQKHIVDTLIFYRNDPNVKNGIIKVGLCGSHIEIYIGEGDRMISLELLAKLM